MFDAVRNNKSVVLVLLALIAVPFAFFGIGDQVRNLGRDTTVATVGRTEISADEFLRAMHNQQVKFNQRDALLDQLITQSLISLQIEKARLVATDQTVQSEIAHDPRFRENGDGAFSMDLYTKRLDQEGTSQARYEASVAQDLVRRQMFGAISASTIIPAATINNLLTMREELREVSSINLPLETFTARVKLAPDAARKFYDADVKRWETPEQVKLQYLVMSVQALGEQVTVSEDEARKFYEDKANAKMFDAPEERQARHILIEVPRGAAEDKRKAAKDKIDALLKQVRAKPDSFAALATENSQDKGSAVKGGDLGFFTREAMVKPFSDAAFALKPGEISDVVTSEYGFHIIKLEAVRGGGRKTFELARKSIDDELKRRRGSEKLSELAEPFKNLVYEQPDSLKPAADKFKLTIQTSDWVAKGAKDLPAPLNNEKLLAAVFSADAVQKHANTDAIDVGGGTMVSAHVMEHQSASIKKFEEVRPQIELLLTTQEALKLAKADGEARIAALRKGQALTDLKWSASTKVSRAQPGELPAEPLKAVFHQAVDKLPAYTGIEVPGRGYTIFRISAVETPKAAVDEKLRKYFSTQYQQMVADIDMRAYLKALRERYKVNVHQSLVDTLTKEKE